MTDEQKKEAKVYYKQLFRDTWKETAEEAYDMVILDEILAACRYGMVPEEELLTNLEQKPFALEVVITGRAPSQRLLETADYISDITKRKHPFDQGLKAREGIEY